MPLLDDLETLLSRGRPPLGRAIEAALGHLDRTLNVHYELSPLEELEDPDPLRFMDLMADPGTIRWAEESSPEHFRTTDGGLSFTHCWDRRVRISYDTPANAELMRLLLQLLRAARRAEALEVVDTPAHLRAMTLRRKVQGYLTRALDSGLSRRSKVKGVGAVLERDPRYRTIRRGRVLLRRVLRRADPSACAPEAQPARRSS